MLNYIWLGLVVLAVLIGGFTGKMPLVTEASIEYAKKAVELAMGLIGIMTVWLGVMRLAEKSGLVQWLARAMRPLMRWLFPEVPSDHPAQGAMVMNMAANMLGLANASTPFGIRAMKHLEKLNPHPGTATNAMCTFLTINTSSIQLLPMTTVALLSAAGSKNPTAIIGTAFLATICSTVAGITAVKLFEKLPMFRLPAAVAATKPTVSDSVTSEDKEEEPAVGEEPKAVETWGRVLLSLFAVCSVAFLFIMAFPEWLGREASSDQKIQNNFVRLVDALSKLSIPFLLSFFPLYAAVRRVKVYEEFVEGAKDGFNVAIRIIPYLVTILVAIGMFRAAGGVDLITGLLRPALTFLQFPPELVPLSLMRPLSGSGSFAIISDLVKEHGPDNILSRMAGTIYGSTETTFYVIAVYFGAVAIRRTRHAVPAGLIADGVGIVASVIICRMMFA